MSSKLSLFDDEEEHVAKISINEAYAQQYLFNKEKEELAKITPELIALKEKELEDLSSEDSEPGDLDSEDDEAFFKTVALIAKNDPKIMDEQFVAFSREDDTQPTDLQSKKKGGKERKNGKKKGGNDGKEDRKNKKKKKKDKKKKEKKDGKSKKDRKDKEGGAQQSITVKDQREADDHSKRKRITVKDYIRETALRDGPEGLLGEELRRSDFKTHVEEQRELKARFLAAGQANSSHEGDDEGDDDIRGGDPLSDDDVGGLFTVREKPDEEVQEEKRAYDEFVADERNVDVLKGFWEAEGLSKDEQFLRDYISKELWREKKFDAPPSYQEIVAADQEDEEELLEQAQFENEWQEDTKFRYQEPGGAQLQRAPKEIRGSVRVNRKKLARRAARKQRREKKAMERKQREEELKRMKNLMKKKIYQQIEVVKECGGVLGAVPFEEDMFDEFDPDRYDQQMEEVFGQDYYEGDDQDLEKPVFSDGLEELEANLEYMDDFEESGRGSGDEDVDFGQVISKGKDEGDDDEEEEEEPKESLLDSSQYTFQSGWSISEAEKEAMKMEKKRRKKGGLSQEPTENGAAKDATNLMKAKTKSTKMCPRIKSTGFCKYGDKCKYSHEQHEVDAQEQAVVASEKRKLDALMDEYYALEAEDIIGGDVHCKFSYTSVKPNSYGLTTEQILFSDEKDLNRHVGLRVLAPYRKKDHRIANKKKRERKQRKRLRESGGRVPLPSQDKAFKQAPKKKRRTKKGGRSNKA